MGESRVRINGVKRLMSIGILGGTFNPVHFGHLRSAEEVCEEFNLGKVFFIPSAQPPHKKSENIIASRYRKEMVEIAIRGNPRFEISTIEIEREGNSYTIDTIYALKKIYTDDDLNRDDGGYGFTGGVGPTATFYYEDFSMNFVYVPGFSFKDLDTTGFLYTYFGYKF